MGKKLLPPDLESHLITHRLDGYVIDHEGEMPRGVAEAILDAAIGGHGEIERIRRRMIIRQREYEFSQRVRKARELRFRSAKARGSV